MLLESVIVVFIGEIESLLFAIPPVAVINVKLVSVRISVLRIGYRPRMPQRAL